MQSLKQALYGHITSIHHVLAHSYLVFFTAVIFGFAFDYLYPIRFLPDSWISSGFLLLIVGTVLIYWAQSISKKHASERAMPKERLTYENFSHGPYKYLRSPTHMGLFLLVAGLGIILNSLLMTLAAIAAFIFTRVVYVQREEEILTERYGAAYLDYKKKIRF